jgi:hypothetical protein
MEINPNVENLEANSTSEDEVWGMPKYQQNYLSNLTNLTDEQYLAVVIIFTVNVFGWLFEIKYLDSPFRFEIHDFFYAQAMFEVLK